MIAALESQTQARGMFAFLRFHPSHRALLSGYSCYSMRAAFTGVSSTQKDFNSRGCRVPQYLTPVQLTRKGRAIRAAPVLRTLHGASGTDDDDLRQAITAAITVVHINREVQLAGGVDRRVP